MRTIYIITYDVRDAKRLRKIFKLLRGYGEHLQYSVFRSELSDREKVELIGKMVKFINQGEDQVLFFAIGKVGAVRETKVHAIGLPYVVSVKEALVV